MKKHYLLWGLSLLLGCPADAEAQTCDVHIDQPQTYSVAVADGNYRITLTVGSRKRAAETVILAESGRLFEEHVVTKKKEQRTVTFVVNKRSPQINDKQRVRLKEREKGYRNWDDSLTLRICGAAPAVSRIEIVPDTSAVTLFLCGNSTVTDQEMEPYASWGQMIPRWFDSHVAISNHAESGLTARSFLAGGRLDKVLTMMRPGDYVFCEFGHNDEKEHQPGDGAWYHYVYNLKIFVDKVRAQGGHIIFCTPTQRRFFEADGQHIKNTHGDFPAAMWSVARREQVPVIDLNGMTRTFFETLGMEGSKRALVFYPANTYPNQPKALADNTHFNPFGAYEVSKMVVMGMKQLALPVVEHLRSDWQDFDPSHPDDPATFRWDDYRTIDTTKPDGN